MIVKKRKKNAASKYVARPGELCYGIGGKPCVAITDYICDYFDAMNTCTDYDDQAACVAETNCGYASGMNVCLTSDFADGTMTSFTTAKAQTDTESVAFKAMFDTCAAYTAQAACEATASEHCEWDSAGSCSLSMDYYSTFASNECDIDVTDDAAAASATVVATSTIAAVAGLA